MQDSSPENPIVPTYAAAFECIGAACEDTCCHGWPIPLDTRTYQKYLAFPEEKLGSIVRDFVTINPPGTLDGLHAQINPTPLGACPFFQPDHLCGIQKTFGPALLSSTCSIYPRALNQVQGRLEGSLMLSCPEAARNILFDPDFVDRQADLFSGAFRTDNVFFPDKGPIYKPHSFFHPIRACLMDMLRDRSRPVSHRLILIGSFCQSLSALRSAVDDAQLPDLLDRFRQALASPWGRAELDAIADQPAARLHVTLRLTDLLISKSRCGPRFLETYWTFIEGVGSPAGGSSSADDVGRFQAAERDVLQPFFAARPHVFENFLLNYLFQNLFPFGRQGSLRFVARSIFEEFLLLAMQFAWLNGLLIGVAAKHGAAFAEAHVVHTVQSFSRELEHDPSLMALLLAFLQDEQLNSLEGMAVLLHEGN